MQIRKSWMFAEIEKLLENKYFLFLEGMVTESFHVWSKVGIEMPYVFRRLTSLAKPEHSLAILLFLFSFVL